MSLQTLIKRGVVIKRVVGKTVSIGMVDHESDLPDRPTLQQVFKGKQAVAILLHVLREAEDWTLGLPASKNYQTEDCIL